jgi:hypothetical protein
MKEEMKRRANKAGRRVTQCVSDPIDVAFLTNAEEQLYKTLIAAGSEAEEASHEKLANSNSWTGNLPWLRLYCSMVHDDAS